MKLPAQSDFVSVFDNEDVLVKPRLEKTYIDYVYKGHFRDVKLLDLIAFVEDLVEAGLRVDLSPTIAQGADIDAANASDMYMQMSNYLKRADDNLRDRAKRALGALPKEEGTITEDDGGQ